jgi:aspartate kinase
MKIFKFGGASVNSAKAVKNVASVLQSFKGENLVVVFSAMGKTTNAMEAIVESAYKNKSDLGKHLDDLHLFHKKILDGLFDDKKKPGISSS